VRRHRGLGGQQTLNEAEHAVTDDRLSSHAHEMDFAPDPAFTAQANGTAAMYDAAAEDHEEFWAEQARTRISWAKDFERTLSFVKLCIEQAELPR